MMSQLSTNSRAVVDDDHWSVPATRPAPEVDIERLIATP
jgi:hypothetical protein